MDKAIAESRLSRMGGSWNRFWFTPADPTVLAVIRIITGVITLYTLIAYCFDLQEFVGANAWVDLKLRQEQYHDSPVVDVPFDWLGTNYRDPSTPQEKAYFRDYFLRWNEKPPLPYPTTAEQAKAYEDYHVRWGVDPRNVLTKGQPVWSIWFHVTDPFWMNVVQAGFVVCALLFAIGLATRISSVLTWFAVLSFIHRDPSSLFGADTMMAVLLLYLMIGPSGAALSVDRLVQCWRARRRGLPVPAPRPSVSANLAIRLIQIHVCIIYGASGLSKLQGQAWWYGTAPWGTLANYEFAPLQYPLYVDFLRGIAKTRWVYELTMTAGALGTLVFEIGYPFLIWRPAFRTLWLWVAVLLHVGIGMFLGLKTFSLLMLAFNLAFVSPETVRWRMRKLSLGRQVDARPGSLRDEEGVGLEEEGKPVVVT